MKNGTKTTPLWIKLDDLYGRMAKTDYGIDAHHRLGIDFGIMKVDLSHIMYCDAAKAERGIGWRLVNPDSYSEDNGRIIDAILELLVWYEEKGLSVVTKLDNIKTAVLFVEWLRELKKLPIRDIKEARVIYEQYTLELKSRMRLSGKGAISNVTASGHQKIAKHLLETIFNDQEKHHISSYVPAIPSTSRNTTVADSEEVEYAFNFYYRFFDQVSDFILDKRPYPFRLDLPSESVWVFPSRVFAYPSHRPKGNQALAYDYENGKIIPKEVALKGMHYNRRAGAGSSWDKRVETFNRANIETDNHKYRVQLAEKGFHAYFMVLLALTGMNDSTLASMLWAGEFDESSERQGFKTIKPRARNKNVRFEIQKEFIGSFRKFIKLRNYVLKQKEFEYLFFKLDTKGAPFFGKEQVFGSFGAKIRKSSFLGLDPNLPAVLSRKFRVHKTRWVYESDGLWAASVMAQSSPMTILDRYHGKSDAEKAVELEEFMRGMHLSLNDRKDDHYMDTSVGGCDDYGNPLQVVENETYQSDCNKPEGCLFCEKYRAHPDEKDLRKLYSLEYLICEVVIVNARSAEHFENVMGPVLDRIDVVIAAMFEKNKELIETGENVKRDVYENENLHPYWEMKMKTLYAMGVVR